MFLYVVWVMSLLSDTPVESPTEVFTELLGKPRQCSSTIFGMRGDKWAGGDALYLGRPVDPRKDVGIAHRTLPVGSKVVLQNPEKPELWVVAIVLDRGPYGANLRHDEAPDEGQNCMVRASGTVWCVKKKASDPGTWRGCVDTTPEAARRLQHRGKQPIRYWPVPNTAPDSIWDWPAYEEQGKKRRERIENRRRQS